MIMRFSGLIAAAALSTTASLFASAAQAQVDCTKGIDCIDSLPSSAPTWNEAMNQAYYSHGKPAYQNQLFPRQFFYIFGPSFNLFEGNYPDVEITKDARSVHNLYVDLLNRQNNAGPVLRTRDLPNPYNTSLQQLPSYTLNRPVLNVETYNEEVPPR